MNSFLDLFSPATYEAFSKSDRSVSGFQLQHQAAANKVKPGDKLICYLTRLSRWFGVLRVLDGPFVDESPIFYPANDPFVLRFHVKPEIWLPVRKAIPIKEDQLWDKLSLTKGYAKSTSAWAQQVKGSLRKLSVEDAALIEEALLLQVSGGNEYPFDLADYQSLVTKMVPTASTVVPVTIPESAPKDAVEVVEPVKDVRESIKVQALLASIGSVMGMKIWLPKADRHAVLEEWKPADGQLLNSLPLSYDAATLKTIEQIDVLWLKGRSIQRAFEVEHTTSIYSGLLRMADLMALQPNINIRLHIVAPTSRREKVFQEIQRPVFSLLENHPLSSACTFISYDGVRTLAAQPNLAYMSDKVLEEYEESVQDE